MSDRGGPFSIERTFDLPKSEKKLEAILSESEQEKFKSKYEKIEKKLLEANSRPNATMPDYVASWGIQAATFLCEVVMKRFSAIRF